MDHLQKIFTLYPLSSQLLQLPKLYFSLKVFVTVMDKTNVKKAPSTAHQTGNMLCKLCHGSVLWLKYIYNAILQLALGVEKGKIIMLTKVGKNTSQLKSCCPILLLSVFSKVFKKLLYCKIFEILLIMLLLYYQFVFFELTTLPQINFF